MRGLTVPPISLKKWCGSNVFLCVGKGSVPVSLVTGMWSYKRNLCRCSELGICKVPFHWPFQTGKLVFHLRFPSVPSSSSPVKGIHHTGSDLATQTTSSVRFPGKGQTSRYQNSEVAREQWQRMRWKDGQGRFCCNQGAGRGGDVLL